MAATSPTPELKTYTGSCACTAFTYTVKLPEVTSVFECDCSICARKGYKWAFPGADCFTVVKDEGKLKVYEFAGKTMAHSFCSVCGTGVYGMRDGAPPGMDMGLNVRTLKDLDILSIPVAQTFNGVAIPPAYTKCPPPSNSTLTSTPSQKIYTGSCHCQANTVSFVTSTPIEELPVSECSCDKCVRTAPMLLTMPKEQVFANTTQSTTFTSYASKEEKQFFCSTCGVCVYDTSTSEPSFKLNMRCFTESVDLAKLKVERVGVSAA